MKLSLRWIFDHIDSDYKKLDITQLVDKFNKITAEIEGYEKFELNLSDFFLVTVKETGSSGILAFCHELNKDINLPARTDALVNFVYVIKLINNKYNWATVSDFNCKKDGLVQAVYVQDDLLNGDWKKEFESSDYIIEVDNKSITHRPDMWGHRGFAREVAAILDLDFKPEDSFLKKIDICEFENAGQDENGFCVKVENQEIGKRLAGIYMPEVTNRPSSLWMASRLMRVGSRPIDFIVDSTNYVMQDISQPMHAFDVNKLKSKNIVARLAQNGEKLELLDGLALELTNKDYVITDGKDPVALAGVMGGKNSGIDARTNSVFIESANFEAASIRNSAIRAKNRTDASARFEKTLDPNQNITGIFRLLNLFDSENIKYKTSKNIISIGKPARELEINLSHELIEKLLGAKVDPKFVENIFGKLGFVFSTIRQAQDQPVALAGERADKKELGEEKENCELIEYKVKVPTNRCTKDVLIKEDLVEEVGRFFGYENTDFVLPKKLTTPYDLSSVLRSRNIKKLLSYGLNMREVRNYAFYDESFLAKLNWAPSEYKEVTNPVSENWRKLVTSLIPHLIKNIEQNFIHHDKLSFFELARIWEVNTESQEFIKQEVIKQEIAKDGAKDILKKGINEKKSLSGIFFDKNGLDFYAKKSCVNQIFDLIGLENTGTNNLSIKWEKLDEKFVQANFPWYFACQTAKITFGDKLVGYAGMLDKSFYGNLFEGDLFAFEFDCDFLVDYKPIDKKLTPISKYQEVSRDISMFVPLAITVDKLTDIIITCSDKIKCAYLLDFFQKDEWKDKKSLTFRFILQDHNKTLEKEEVDIIYDLVVEAIIAVGAELR